MDKGEIAAAVIALLGGGVGSSFLTMLFMRPKTKADVENVHAEIVLTINKAAIEQIESLRKAVEILESKVDALTKQNERLSQQNSELLDKLGKYQRKDEI